PCTSSLFPYTTLFRSPACVPVGGICGPTGQTGTHHGPEHIAAVRITDTGSRSDRHGQPSRDLGRTDLGGLPRRRSAGLRRTRGGGDSRSDLILLGPDPCPPCSSFWELPRFRSSDALTHFPGARAAAVEVLAPAAPPTTPTAEGPTHDSTARTGAPRAC